MKEKLRQAQHITSSTELDPWLTEVVPVDEVDIVEPEVLVQIERARPGSSEKQTPASALPLLQTKFPCATEQDAELVAPLFDSSRSTIVLSSETPLKYLIMPLLLGSPKMIIFVSSSGTRRESFLYSVNARKQENGAQKSYGIHWGYGFKSFSEYVPFADVLYYCSTERIEAYRRALWKNIPRAVADMIDQGFISAIAVSYQDFLSSTFHHFLSVLKTTLHQLILDWDSRFKDIALRHASTLCKPTKQIIVIERAQLTGRDAYTHLEFKQIYAKTFSEGAHIFANGRGTVEASSILCVLDSANMLHPGKPLNTVENGMLCVHLQSLMDTQTIEYLALSAEHEPFDLSKVDTLLLGCINVSPQFIINNLCMYCGVSVLRGLTSVVRIVSPNIVLQHVQHVLNRALMAALYGPLIANLLSSQMQSTNDNQNEHYIILSFQRLRSQLTFLTGLKRPPIDACLWWDAASDIAAYMNLRLHSFGQELYTYKLLGSTKQSSIERKYPVCQWIKQACELEDTPKHFTMGTLLCLLSSSTPDGVPRDHAGLEHHLATIHDTEPHVVCCPCYGDLPPCILFSGTSAKRPEYATIDDWYFSKTLGCLKADLDSLLTELVENHSKEFRDSVLLEHSNIDKYIEASPSTKIWRERVSAIQQATGMEYNPIAACVALLADDSLGSHQLYVLITLKISLEDFLGRATNHCSLFTKAARNIMGIVDHFFVQLKT